MVPQAEVAQRMYEVVMLQRSWQDEGGD